MSDEFIFVYGTLRKESVESMHSLFTDHCKYISDAVMQGRLYDVGGYPGLIESNDSRDKVHGELYRILNPDQLLPRLDDYEECTEKFPKPHEYVRKKLPMIPADGRSLSAWVYVFNHDVSGLKHIDSDNYLSFLKMANG